jgi:hypothetical protein
MGSTGTEAHRRGGSDGEVVPVGGPAARSGLGALVGRGEAPQGVVVVRGGLG